MAEYVYGSGVPYGQYLQENAYVRDITGQIIKSGEANQNQISAQTREIVASNERLVQESQIGFNRIEGALSSVNASIDNLRSDFNYNMGLVLDQLQIQNQLTFGILEKLDAIHKTLVTPEQTKAREFYYRGCERLSKGLLDKALEMFLKAEEINDTDFFTEYQIGKLYLYGVNEDVNVIDLAKAEQHLHNSARYGKAEVSALPEFYQLTGEALLHASIACYAQANDQQIITNTVAEKEFLLKAFQLVQQACEIYPSLSESQYHLAKYAALLGNVDASMQGLEKSISLDFNYCLKVELDRDFDKLRENVHELFDGLRVKMRNRAQNKLKNSQMYISDMVYLSDKAKRNKEKIKNLISDAEKKFGKETLFDIHDLLRILDEVELIILKINNSYELKYSMNEEIY
jgi:tetratricopeptide (TPR) repeat protein